VLKRSHLTTALAAAASGAAMLLLVAGCTAPVASAPDPVEPAPEPVTSSCPEPLAGAFGGPAVALDDAELLGAPDLPEGVCAYGSESGESIWILGESYDPGFPSRISAWLEPLGWTAEQLDTWGEGDLENVGFTPPADIEISSAFAHAFDAYPDSVSFNMGIDQEFLTHYGVEPGDELAIFAAWR
jgi:hypothetical protein